MELDVPLNDSDGGELPSWSHHSPLSSPFTMRRLPGDDDKADDSLDYAVLTVAVLTLGLLLIVEFGRHKIDHLAVGRPFFSTVLEGVYRELATLGIVEFGIYLLQTYYTEYNKAAKDVFADVHFMLFFAALFNALESVLLAIFTSRVSNRLWVKTEQLDVDNYLELREEYDKVDKELKQARRQQRPDMEDRTAEVAFEWNLQGFKYLRDGIWDALRYPRLNRKHHNLLVQVRFHELRVHFLKANNLPLKLKVSDYLKRSEMHVLKKMVHISPFAWLLLTGGLNLLYFLMGMVAYVTEDLTDVGTAMSAIFVCSMFSMLIISLLIFNKVKRIYRGIMRNKLIDYVPTDDPSGSLSDRQKQDQLKLFWGAEPKYIIGMMQFMQIGFAVALSILIVFPDEISGEIKAIHYAILVGFAYVLFLYIAARVIPRFTLCTSLGQLVNKRRLQETLSAFHLEEARKKQKILKDVQEAEEAFLLQQAQRESKATGKTKGEADSKRAEQKDEWVRNSLSTPSKDEEWLSTRSLLSALDLEGDKNKSKRGSFDELSASEGSLNRALLAALAETKTEDLRSIIPKTMLPKKSNSSREERIKARRQARKKAASDGVASMRLMKSTSKMSGAALDTLNSVDEADDGATAPAPAPAPAPAMLEPGGDALARKPSRRRSQTRRRKSLSANAAIEMMRDLTAAEDATSDTPAKKGASPKQGSSALNPLIEDIPIMSVPASQLSIPVGRQSMRNYDASPDDEGRRATFSSESQGVGASGSVLSFLGQDGTQTQPHPLLSEPKPTSVSPSDRVPRSSVRFADESSAPESARPSEGSSAKGGESALGEGDDDTVDTAGSDAGHSDVDDIPDVDPSEKNMLANVEADKPISDRCRDFFSGRIYRHMSAVFGTMICFFLVGMRVESLLHAANTVGDPGNTWELNPGAAFWLETVWLSMFITVSSFVIFLFRSGPPEGYKKRMKMLVAGFLDVSLCSLCLFLLMLSETQRECDDTDTESNVECSQTFGNRVGDGVGNIEPFTSLVALRLLRFFVARKLLRFLCRKNVEYHRGREDRVSFHLGIYDQTVRSTPQEANEPQSHHHHEKDMEHETGTLVELWNYGMSLYPEIVEKYGEFSGELLQAMLGLEIVDEKQPTGRPSASEPSTPSAENMSVDIDTKQGEIEQLDSPAKPSMSLGRRYSSLSVVAQSVILAGRLGKPVRSVSDASSRDGSDTNDSPIKSTAHSVAETLNSTPSTPIEFEVDTQRHATEMSSANDKSGTSSSPFIAPNARLIRSMRRCDKKLLPLLDKWTTVDVVMTKFEIVYFEAPTVFEQDQHANGETYRNGVFQDGKSVRQAVIATAGGKGLRLCDIAQGRKVVGHLELSSVDAVSVERSIPKREAPSDDMGEFDSEHVADEFWKTCSELQLAGIPARNCRWELVKQDHLVVDSIHGMLHLRFYSDLEDAELHSERLWNEREDFGDIFKNNALQWCQTVVRLCGIQQLRKQHLPNFGSDNSDELRDYLVVEDYNMRDVKRITKAGKMRRAKSGVSLSSMLERKSVRLSRGSSVGEQSSNSSSKHRRASIASHPSAKGSDNVANMV